MNPKVSLSVLYALIYAPYGAILPFLPVLLREQGCSDADIGVISSASGLAAIFTPLVVAHFADRFKDPRQVLVALQSIVGITSGLWWYSTGLLTLFAIVFCVFGGLISTLSLVDSYSIRFLEETGDHPSRLPVLRIWGSVGFTVPALILWGAQQWTTMSVTYVLPIGAAAGVIAALTALRIPKLTAPPAFLKLPSVDAATFVWNGELRIFFIVASISGIASTFFYLGQPLLLQELGTTSGAIGLIINLGVLAEIIAMPFIPGLVQRYGAKLLVTFGYLALAIRLVILAFTESVSIIVITQLLHAIMIAGSVVIPPLILAKHASGSFRFSLQSLYTTVIQGITRTVASWLWAGFALLPHQSSLASVQWSLLLASLLSLGALVLWSVKGAVSEEK